MSTPDLSKEESFDRRKVAREKIIQEWHCAEHSLPDKPVACWHDKNRPGLCFTLELSRASSRHAREKQRETRQETLLCWARNWTNLKRLSTLWTGPQTSMQTLGTPFPYSLPVHSSLLQCYPWAMLTSRHLILWVDSTTITLHRQIKY